MTESMLEMTGISKRFGDKVALERIDLAVSSGEVHAVCGENGAGKSTLMNILAGIHQPDSGTVLLRGKPVELSGASAATALGIGMVHQHFTLVPSMTVAENIYLGRQPRKFGLITDKKAMRANAAELISRYGFQLDPLAKIEDLSVGARQRVEIIKALAVDAKLLILDEPTAVLTPPEVHELLDVIDALRDRGTTVLFITHKLREVKEISDRVTVIRRGLSIGTHETANISLEEIAQEMVGRSVFLTETRSERHVMAAALPVLQAKNLSYIALSGKTILDDISFELRAGEILGIAGVEGNGQTELAEVLTGLKRSSSGSLTYRGQAVTGWSPGALRGAGVRHIPEDRLDRGLSKEMTVAENLAASNYSSAHLKRRGLVSKKSLDLWATTNIDKFDIRGAQPDTPVGDLSGGNMQKVVIARELSEAPELLVVAQPTRGVDIGASEFVHHQILTAAAEGCAVLLISSELSEILALSDKIGVMFQGSLVEIVNHSEATEERIGLLMNTGKIEVEA